MIWIKWALDACGCRNNVIIVLTRKYLAEGGLPSLNEATFGVD